MKSIFYHIYSTTADKYHQHASRWTIFGVSRMVVVCVVFLCLTTMWVVQGADVARSKPIEADFTCGADNVPGGQPELFLGHDMMFVPPGERTVSALKKYYDDR